MTWPVFPAFAEVVRTGEGVAHTACNASPLCFDLPTIAPRRPPRQFAEALRMRARRARGVAISALAPAAHANRPPRLEGQPSSTPQSRPRPRPLPGARSPSSGWRVGRGRWRRAPPDLPSAWRARPISPQAALRSGDARSRSSDRESPQSRAGPRPTPPQAQEIAPLRSIYRGGSRRRSAISQTVA